MMSRSVSLRILSRFRFDQIRSATIPMTMRKKAIGTRTSSIDSVRG